MESLRRISAVILAAVILSMSGCAVESDKSLKDGRRSVSEVDSLEVDSSESDSSDVSSPDSDTSDESTMTISIPDIDISIPTFSVPSFSISSEDSEIASNSSSEIKSEKTISENPVSSSSSGTASVSGETQTIGNSNIGYLDVPADFVAFQDLDVKSDVQYSDSSGKIIFTMNYISKVEESEATIEQLGQSLAYHMEQEGAQNITGATVKVSGKYDAKQVYSYWPEDDSFLVIDLLEVDGKIIYLSAEFPSKDSDMVKYLDTYNY